MRRPMVGVEADGSLGGGGCAGPSGSVGVGVIARGTGAAVATASDGARPANKPPDELPARPLINTHTHTHKKKQKKKQKKTLDTQ